MNGLVIHWSRGWEVLSFSERLVPSDVPILLDCFTSHVGEHMRGASRGVEQTTILPTVTIPASVSDALSACPSFVTTLQHTIFNGYSLYSIDLSKSTSRIDYGGLYICSVFRILWRTLKPVLAHSLPLYSPQYVMRFLFIFGTGIGLSWSMFLCGIYAHFIW